MHNSEWKRKFYNYFISLILFFEVKNYKLNIIQFCYQVCVTVNERVCNQVPEQVCQPSYSSQPAAPVCQTTYEQECSTTFEQVLLLEFRTSVNGCDKMPTTKRAIYWYDSLDLNSQDCQTVYEQQCSQSVQQQCRSVTEQDCTTVQEQQCDTVYEEQCTTVTEQECTQETERVQKVSKIKLSFQLYYFSKIT